MWRALMAMTSAARRHSMAWRYAHARLATRTRARFTRRGVRLLRHANNPLLEASVLHDLGSLHFTLRRFADAQRTLQRALALCEANALTVVRQFCLLSLAFAEIELGQLDSAQTHVEQTVRGEQATGESLVSAMVQLASARISTRRGQLDAAASGCTMGWSGPAQRALRRPS